MRCERVTRPTWRGVKRGADSVKEDIFLELSRTYRVKVKSGAGWMGFDIATSHFLCLPQDSKEMSDMADW